MLDGVISLLSYHASIYLTTNADSARVLDDARAVLTARGLDHATVQVEPPASGGDCNCDAV